MLGESCLGSLGREILRSVYLPKDGPEGMEFGNVKTSVTTANIAMVLSSTAILRGATAGTGLPKRLRWTGILKDVDDGLREEIV